MTTQRTSVSDAVAHEILRHDATTFGLMGNGNAHLVSVLTGSNAHFVSVRHEVASIIAAQTFYLSTGRTAVATVTFGAGFTNMLTSLAEARLARVPVVVVVGCPPSTGPRRQDIDQVAAAEAVYVKTFVVGRGDAAAQTRRAFEIAERDRVPVIISIPYDLVDAPIGPQENLPGVPSSSILLEREIAERPAPAAEDLEEVASRLRRATRPLILAGRGAVLSEAGAPLREIGDRLGGLFATSLMAHGLFQSEWDIGIAGGFSSQKAARIIARADVVLVVGASLNLYQMRYGALLAGASEVMQVDTLAQATHPQVTRFMRSDAKEFAAALVGLITRVDEGTWRSRISSTGEALTGDDEPHGEFGPDGRLDPRAAMVALNGLLPEQRTIVQDTGHFMGWAARHWGAPDPKGMLLPGLALQSIGLGVGAALGIAHARPDRLAILVAGDGGAAMALAEFDTLVRTTESALVIVLNDAAYGMEVHQYGPRGLDMTAMRFNEMDFAAIATSLGARGAKIRSLSDLEVIREWLDGGAKGTFVADVAISPSIAADWLELSNQYYAKLAGNG